MTLLASFARFCTPRTFDPSGIGIPAGKLSGTSDWLSVGAGGKVGAGLAAGGVTCSATCSGALRGVMIAPKPLGRSATLGGGGASCEQLQAVNGIRPATRAAPQI